MAYVDLFELPLRVFHFSTIFSDQVPHWPSSSLRCPKLAVKFFSGLEDV